jgi:hypothetical protein
MSETKNTKDIDKQRKRRDIGIYKANPKGTGSVAQFKMANNNDCMFLECANQIGEMKSSRPYDWDNKIIVKLGEADICKMLAYFRLHQPGAPLKLYHQSPGGGNKGIELKWQEYNGRQSYYLTVTHQKAKGEAPNRVGTPIGLDETEYLKVGFKKALAIFLAWD